MTPEEAFDQYHRAIFAFAWRMTRDVGLAEDITQDCFVAFMRSPARFDEARGSLRTYLFSIARNLTMRCFRDRRLEASLEDAAEPAAAGSPDAAVCSAVRNAVSSLPLLQQEVVILFEYEGLTLEEIAAVTGCDTGAVKSRLHRARARLKRILASSRNAVGEAHGTV